MTRQKRERAARYVRDRRGYLGLSQRELATRAGVDIKTVYNAESGKFAPNAVSASRLSVALDWPSQTVSSLYDGADPPDAADPRPELVRRNWADPQVRQLWELEHTPDDVKAGLVATYMAARDSQRDDDNGGRLTGTTGRPG